MTSYGSTSSALVNGLGHTGCHFTGGMETGLGLCGWVNRWNSGNMGIIAEAQSMGHRLVC